MQLAIKMQPTGHKQLRQISAATPADSRDELIRAVIGMTIKINRTMNEAKR